MAGMRHTGAAKRLEVAAAWRRVIEASRAETAMEVKGGGGGGGERESGGGVWRSRIRFCPVVGG